MTIAPVLAGAVAGVLLAATEAIWLSAAVSSAVAPVGGPIAVFAALIPRGFIVGAGLGLGGTVCLAATQWLARLAERRGADEAHCFAAIAGAFLLAGIAALAQPLWGSRGGRFVTDHPIVLTLLGAAAAWCSYEVVLLFRFIVASPAACRWMASSSEPIANATVRVRGADSRSLSIARRSLSADPWTKSSIPARTSTVVATAAAAAPSARIEPIQTPVPRGIRSRRFSVVAIPCFASYIDRSAQAPCASPDRDQE